jgi:hypothetical protein
MSESNDRKERLHVFVENLRGPEPLLTKLRLLFQNNWYKLSHHTDCCGHPGQPGC